MRTILGLLLASLVLVGCSDASARVQQGPPPGAGHATAPEQIAAAAVYSTDMPGGFAAVLESQLVDTTNQTEPPPLIGIEIVDAAAKAVVASDIGSLTKLLLPETIPCSDVSRPGPLRPRCQEGQDEGTLVQALLRTGCSSDLVQIDRLESEFDQVLSKGFQLEAVFQPPAAYYPPGGDYIVVFNKVVPDASFPQRIGLVVTDQGIIAVKLECDPGSIFPSDLEARYLYRRLNGK